MKANMSRFYFYDLNSRLKFNISKIEEALK